MQNQLSPCEMYKKIFWPFKYFSSIVEKCHNITTYPHRAQVFRSQNYLNYVKKYLLRASPLFGWHLCQVTSVAARLPKVSCWQNIEINITDMSQTRWFPSWLACWLTGLLLFFLAGWLVGWLAGWLAGWLVGWLAGWFGLVDWLAGWLVSWLYDWFICIYFLVGWLVD